METKENKFNSVDEIINDFKFKQFVDKNIEELKQQRRMRPIPKQGYRYKRNWFDRLYESRQLNPNYFISNICDIWNKKCSLSSDLRIGIKYVCDKALFETIHYYKELNTKQTK